jgi:hypothetical protein
MNENHSDKDTNREGDQDNDRKFNSVFGSGIRARLARNGIEFVSGIGFYAFGDDCTNWGYIYWGFFFHYLCIASGALIVTEHALGSWPQRKNRVWAAYIGLCILLASFYVKSSWPRPPPRGRGVDLYFALAGQRGHLPLPLTNDLFKFTMKTNPFVSEPLKVRGVIMMPLLPGTTSVTTEFVLKNISSNEIDRGSVKIILPLRAGTNKYIINSSWIEDRLAFGPAAGYGFAMPYMRPGEFQSLPQLGFEADGTPPDAFGVITMPKDMDAQLWQMRFCFIEVPPTVEPWPFVTFPKMIDNGNGTLYFQPEWTAVTNTNTGQITLIGKGP